MSPKSPKTSLPIAHPPKQVKREGFILQSNGRLEYDHTQDIEYLEACQRKATREQKRRELEEALPPAPFKRITLGNASHQDLADAHYLIERRKAKKQGDE